MPRPRRRAKRVYFAQAGDFDCFLLAGRYTLLEQEPMNKFLPLCEKKKISVIVGGPYNSGILATGAVEGAYYNYQPALPRMLAWVRPRLKRSVHDTQCRCRRLPSSSRSDIQRLLPSFPARVRLRSCTPISPISNNRFRPISGLNSNPWG